jgi:hypothetical protein
MRKDRQRIGPVRRGRLRSDWEWHGSGCESDRHGVQGQAEERYGLVRWGHLGDGWLRSGTDRFGVARAERPVWSAGPSLGLEGKGVARSGDVSSGQSRCAGMWCGKLPDWDKT